MKRPLQKLALALAASMLSLCLQQQAHATPIPWGDPVLGHSWDQLWVQELDQSFDTVTATIAVPPSTVFEAPGMFAFSLLDWAVQSATTHEIVSQGSDTTRLEFKTHFSGLPTDYTASAPLIVDMRFYNDGAYLEGHRWIWDGAQWTDPRIPGVPDSGTTLVLLGLSAIGLACVRKKLS